MRGNIVPSTTGNQPSQETEIRALHRALLDAWDRRDASALASLFAEDGNVVGFDGSPLNGRAEIKSVLAGIFAHHKTPPFTARVREVRLLGEGVGLLRAVVGMVPPGQIGINPALNAMQTLVASHRTGRWQIELFQNTPAAFHGRPEMSKALTEELTPLLPKTAENEQ